MELDYQTTTALGSSGDARVKSKEPTASSVRDVLNEAETAANDIMARLTKLEDHVNGAHPREASDSGEAPGPGGVIPGLDNQARRILEMLRTSTLTLGNIEHGLT